MIDSSVVDFTGTCSRSLGAVLNVLGKGPQTDPFVQNIEIKFYLEKHHMAAKVTKGTSSLYWYITIFREDPIIYPSTRIEIFDAQKSVLVEKNFQGFSMLNILEISQV